MEKKKVFWITGYSQGGTYLMMSLLDNHPELLVFPAELSVLRLIHRQQQYRSPDHMLADFFLGMPNWAGLAPHFGLRERGGKEKPRNKTDPQVGPEMFDCLKNIRALKKGKIFPGITDDAFGSETFVDTYVEYILENREGVKTVPDMVDLMFEALAHTAGIEGHPKRLNSFKSVFTNFDIDAFYEFRKVYPTSPILFIQRNPYGRLLSRMKYSKKFDKMRLATAPFKFRRLCRGTARDVKKVKQLKELDNIMTVNYEDVVMNTEQEMSKLAQFLEISFDESMLTPTMMGYPVKNITDRTGGKAGVISNSSVSRWQEELTFMEKKVMQFSLSFYGR